MALLARTLLLCFATFMTTTADGTCSGTSIDAAFRKEGVVPDVVSVAPRELLDVTYGSHKVDCGNELTPSETSSPPRVRWNAQSGSLYTLVMTDPDAPSRRRPLSREWHHWLVTNIPGEDVSRGDVLSTYIGPSPPPGSGLHRYVLLVYRQQGRISDSEHGKLGRSGANRANFKVEAFARKHSLGYPVAGNFFQAE